MASCYVPFNNRNLDISLFVLRPTVLSTDDLLETLKKFSSYNESQLGCVHSSIFTSIHGSLIIWYGAWLKRSDENKQLLNATLLSMLSNLSSMSMLIEQSFFDAYAGESRDGSPAAKFFAGDILSISSATVPSEKFHQNPISYACLAIFRDRFNKMNGAKSGVCMRSQTMPKIVSLFVWKSLQYCYADILNSDYRRSVLPYLEGFALDVKYDVFRVVYVSGDDNVRLYPENRMIGKEVEKNEGFPVGRDFDQER